MLRLDGYVRVSRVGGRGGEGYISPSVQKDAIAAYAKELDGSIVAWHDDQDFSGGNTQRPGFQAALDRLRDGETDGIVVMRVDRFARSVADGAAIVREIVDRDQVFASCHERIDPRTPEGKFMLTSFLANAELFLDQAKASWWTAKRRAVARGAHIGPTPVGYRRIPKGEERGGCLEPDPIYGPAMTELFKRASGGDGPSALARWMSDRAPGPKGRRWQSSEVSRWLKSRVYLGEIRYGELVNAEAHEPLTDLETWERSQREPGERRKSPSPFLLSGILRCANCRYSMGGFNHGGTGRTPVYRCHRARNGGCDSASVITVERIEGYLIEQAEARMKGMVAEAAGDVDLGQAEREAADAEAEVLAYVSDVNARRVLGEDAWQHGLSARTADRDAKQAKVDELRSNLRLVSVSKKLENLDRDELRDLLRGLYRTVFVRRRPRGAPVEDRVLPIWSDDPRSIDLPGPHRGGPFKAVRW